ncbi:ferredoxin reductase family protein [Rhabdothermincola salaria]|uniref:ferredoxin reductase family protein n=1 Tax=Rhabdothermincola salaria TaxID=2903142 RepID=UPI001E54F7E5|nr:ferric reductase-like transmembrane domain-containing protein [Rhabdothermincola salaria]MCD9625039.1 ferric reductase-like transmembrane domain-containing protein [Rhabdothermincola salaria]
MRLITSAVLWISLYLALAVAPLLFALLADPPPARAFWTELSVAFGFVGLALLGLQFAVSARSNGVDAPYGHDVVLRFHRQISMVALGLVLAHPIILFVTDAAPWGLLNVFDAPWRARFGVLSVLALLAIVATSLWRLQLRLSYEVWRLSHDLLAVVIMVAALLHVELVGHYVAGTWRQVLWAVMSLGILGVLAWIRLIKPLAMRRRPWVVDEVVERADDVWSLRLRPVGHDGLRFDPGQFAWITVGRSPLRVTEHPFSMSSSAEEPDLLEFTIKAAGDFTSTVGEIQPGTRVFVDGPYGVFTPIRNEGAGFLFVAGGIGVTPIMSILRTLADLGDRRRMTLVYANQTWDDVAFADELADLEQRLELRVVHVLAEPDEDWEGEAGFVTHEILEPNLPERPDRVRCFLCGPAPMMDAVTHDLLALGLDLEQIHNEEFVFA